MQPAHVLYHSGLSLQRDPMLVIENGVEVGGICTVHKEEVELGSLVRPLRKGTHIYCQRLISAGQGENQKDEKVHTASIYHLSRLLAQFFWCNPPPRRESGDLIRGALEKTTSDFVGRVSPLDGVGQCRSCSDLVYEIEKC